ncbi:unnamed protein product [Effrenium voratum]|nr:unnamed protein product [Effrenium voratum]
MAAPTAFGALGAFAGVTCASWASPPAKPERTRRLGDPSYDLEKISAPAATGALLRAIAWVLADSPWGALLRRWLINKKENGSALLQDLAAQACQPPSCGVAYQPMVRLPEAQWRQHAAAAEASSGLQLLQRGFGVDTAPRLFSTVEETMPKPTGRVAARRLLRWSGSWRKWKGCSSSALLSR